MVIGLHNIGKAIVENSNYNLSLITPDFFSSFPSPDIDSVFSDGENKIIRLRKLGDLFPDDWNSFRIRLSAKIAHLFQPSEFTIRLFSELGPKDHKFNVLFTIETG